ncbi:MAG: protein kinase, partial [Actinomycetota bacterium]|nr:protein kinase [Actinomycetota bacterium]
MERSVAEREDRLLGAVLDGRYQVDAVLARGGMSTVYEGVDTRLERPVAIKVMAPGFASDPVFQHRFEREARAAARLQHPNVVGVYDQGIDRSPTGDAVFLVMELVPGGTLRDLLREHGALPIALALSVAEPVASALASAHREGLVHRDVKPENVLIGPGGVVKVADFGLVRAVAESSTTTGNVILGTVAYLSPEQVATGAADARSDVYAAGVLLYELLTGHPPYTGDTALSVAYRHVNDDVPPPSEAVPALPAPLDDLVVAATRRDPAARPEDASAFLLALQRVRTQLGLHRVVVPVPAQLVDTPEDGAPGGGAPEGPRPTRAMPRTDLPADTSPQRAPPPPVDGEAFRRQRARSRRAFLAWLIVVLLLATAVGTAAWWLGAGRWTPVPSVVGLDRAAAEAMLTEADLGVELIEDHSDTVAPGLVVVTDPVAGDRAIRGSDIGVVLSLGSPIVPDLPAGTSPEDAADIVTDADLRPVTDPAAAEFSDVVPGGAVIGLRPASGTVLTVGAPVTLVVSRGPAPTTVPDVRGLPEADATRVLADAGLDVDRVERRFDRDVPGGQTIGTDPEAGDDTIRGSEVTLVVSTSLVVPDVVGRPRDEALATLREAGFTPRERGDGAG